MCNHGKRVKSTTNSEKIQESGKKYLTIGNRLGKLCRIEIVDSKQVSSGTEIDGSF